MASLTPGVLSKLLESSGNKEARVTGEHRHALLQVIEIVPRFSHEDTWQSKGYFLKVSDSLHSAYVSVPENDAELICSDKVQLGQFVYVTRLDSAKPSSSIPVVHGLNPLPKRRPCVGNPIDLVSSELLHVGANVNADFRRSKKGSNVNKNKGLKKGEESSKGKLKGLGLRNNNGNCEKVVVEMRRLSLDSSRRAWDQSPVSKNGSGTPSSRFMLKSASSSPNVVHKNLSLKFESPLKSPTSSVLPLKNKNENLCPKPTSNPSSKSTPPSKSSKSPSAGTVNSQLVKVPINVKNWSDVSVSWEDLPSPMCNLGKKVVTHRNLAFDAAVRALHEASAADTVIQCMCLFAELCESTQILSAGLLVKQFLELHQSLQRATMVLDSLLTPSPETKQSSHSTLEVPFHKNATSWVQAAIVTNLSKFNLFRAQGKGETLNGEKCHYVVIENSCEEMHTVNLAVQNKQNRVTQTTLLPNSTAKRLPSKRNLLVAKNKYTDNKQYQSKESEIHEAATLAEKLLEASREWFLKYLEESLDDRFGLKSEEGSTEIACLLGQLKNVNHWLDNLVGGDKVDHRVENLRKNLYRFLLEQVDSAVASSQ
ncbi:hypothetical protein HN51_025774 [Arachis hypogaea]|uniref:DUF936 family protein n=1 Tax=Arachis hypogaea TaxID=3818 RepID=A0A445CF63_ARAHY|nr:uncharacterized protein LOC112703022 [Arachis hypogaea]QHO28276.1 uncharacterized protein DS421_7g215280 [Arachis hypogaea]RYR49558.1 hypothetical protein Ahy_A07g036068 [Arachis hypogaea]